MHINQRNRRIYTKNFCEFIIEFICILQMHIRKFMFRKVFACTRTSNLCVLLCSLPASIVFDCRIYSFGLLIAIRTLSELAGKISKVTHMSEEDVTVGEDNIFHLICYWRLFIWYWERQLNENLLKVSSIPKCTYEQLKTLRT